MLYQYDEEIEGAKKESFTLEGKGEFNPEENKARELAKVREADRKLFFSGLATKKKELFLKL